TMTTSRTAKPLRMWALGKPLRITRVPSKVEARASEIPWGELRRNSFSARNIYRPHGAGARHATEARPSAKGPAERRSTPQCAFWQGHCWTSGGSARVEWTRACESRFHHKGGKTDA